MARPEVKVTLTAPGVVALRIAIRALADVAREDHIGNVALTAECALADIAELLDGERITEPYE